MPYTHLVPSDTKRTLTAQIDQCENLALILARYIPEEAIEKQNVPNEKNKKVHDVWLSELLRDFTGDNLEKYIFANLDRWSAMIKARDVSAFQMRLRGRMVVGLGGKNPLEFGITLNKLTGLPYIPGSALKGLARSYALLSLANQAGIPIESDALKAFDEALGAGQYDENESARHYHRAFGTQADAGGCVFYDAVISNVIEPQKSLFTIDVMTPHFVKYYTADSAPHDGDNPNPVSYVVVREGISFGFAIGTRAGFIDEGTRKQARDWLRGGLEELGVGAKTAQGYGVFTRVE